MLSAAQSPAVAQRLDIPAWLLALALIAVAASLGPVIGSSSRYLFLAGSLAVGVVGWRQSHSSHLQAVLVLFVFTPLARRMVDLSIGYDLAGTMIAGPLLALLAPLSDVQNRTFNVRIFDRRLGAHLILGAGVLYAVVLTILNGDWSQALSGLLKWGVPLAYGVMLYASKPDPEVMLDAMAKSLLWILPVVGAYGVYQFVDPPLWDRYWLAMASIKSAGTPEPFEVRTFSTLHAPAAFATFTAVGLILVVFLRRGAFMTLILVPAAVALMLSAYRTAWLSLMVGLIICLFFRPTRTKASVAVALGGIVVAGAIALVPFSDVITGRLATLADPSNDASGQERLGQFSALYGRPDSSLWGNGFSAVDVGVAGAEAVDGMLIACWTSMGIVAGMIFLAALVAIIAAAVASALSLGTLHGVVLAAIAIGFLVEVPLATIVSGELGFLFYTFTSLALCGSEGRRR